MKSGFIALFMISVISASYHILDYDTTLVNFAVFLSILLHTPVFAAYALFTNYRCVRCNSVELRLSLDAYRCDSCETNLMTNYG